LIASTSEVYGKNTNVPFHEDADLVLGATTKGRWSYAASKAARRILALSYWKEKEAAGNRRSFFQHGGPAADRALWMVLPNFVKRALDGETHRSLRQWPGSPAASATSGHRGSAAPLDCPWTAR